MAKLITFQQGLDTIAEELKLRGYEVFPYEGASQAYDALLYYEEENAAFFKNLASVPFKSSNHAASLPGVFMINVNGKSIDDIINMIERRSYTPIF